MIKDGKEYFIVCRNALTYPEEWRAACELLKRGYVVDDRQRHFFWEWMVIKKI